MILQNKIKKNSYYDSATLMLLTSKISDFLQTKNDVAIMMGSDMNKNLMKKSELLNKDGEEASPNDVIFAIRAKDEQTLSEAFSIADDILNKKAEPKKAGSSLQIYNVEEATRDYPDYNMAVVSLPGAFAAREVKKLLENNVNVLLFSDNVSIEEEIMLKDLALEKGLLMMGPDCGTAIINEVGLGFANKVKKGNIGLVAASGTGLQEVVRLLSNNGVGISQAFGTGGRDLSEQVGGRMMLHCLNLLENDENTHQIVIISKPPAKSVVNKIIDKINTIKKPVIACFLGADSELLKNANCKVADTLEKAALLTLNLEKFEPEFDIKTEAQKLKTKLNNDQKYIRGLYCGGTLAYETILLLKHNNVENYSNIAKKEDEKLKDSHKSVKNSILDLGDDEFTVGKPHPMIEPSLRRDRLLEEIKDKEVGVVLLDVEIGYGSHENPAQLLVDEIKKAKEFLSKENREIVFITTICGTHEDYQNYQAQKTALQNENIYVMQSNAEAVRFAIEIMGDKL